MFVKVIDMLRMEESAFKSHMKGEKNARGTLDRATSSSTQMFTFLHKKVISSCDQRSESD